MWHRLTEPNLIRQLWNCLNRNPALTVPPPDDNRPRQQSNQPSCAATDGQTSVKHFCFPDRQKIRQLKWALCVFGFLFCSLFVNVTVGLLNRLFTLTLRWQSSKMGKCWQCVTALLFATISNCAPNNFVPVVSPPFSALIRNSRHYANPTM